MNCTLYEDAKGTAYAKWLVFIPMGTVLFGIVFVFKKTIPNRTVPIGIKTGHLTSHLIILAFFQCHQHHSLDSMHTILGLFEDDGAV